MRRAITSTARSERRNAVRAPGWASTLVAPRPIPPEGRGDQLREVARCRARHATRRRAVLEARARADDQVTDRAGDKDVAGAGLAEDPRGDVHRDPRCRRPAVRTRRCGCRRGSRAQCLGVGTQRLGAADGLRRAVERGEVAVAGALPPCRRRRCASSAVISPKRASTARHRSSPAAAAVASRRPCR